MRLIKGKIIADNILAKMLRELRNEKTKPGLAVVLVGNDQASKIYINLKNKAAERIGMNFFLFRFGEKNENADIIKKIKLLNSDKKIHGIIVQLPLPKKFPTQKIIDSIDPQKDADGFHPKNLKLFFARKEFICPVFPRAILKMIDSIPRNKKIKEAVILTRSGLFGKVMASVLISRKIRIKVALLKGEKEMRGKMGIDKNIFKKADLIITALGIPGFIRGDMVKKNAIIIDGGITKIGKKVLGDADLDSVSKIAAYVSPVPGGVGPVTVATLIENVYFLSKKQNQR